MKTDTSNEQQNERDLGKASIKSLLGMLKPRQLWGIGSGLFTVISIAFSIGAWTQSKTGILSNYNSDIVVGYTQLQNAIKSRPSIRVFTQFLDDAATSDWDATWNKLGPGWKKEQDNNDKNNLKYDFRMTNSMHADYFRPMRITDDFEEYYVEFEFQDNLPKLLGRDRFLQSPLGDVIGDSTISELTKEIARVMPKNFKVDHQQSRDLYPRILGYLKTDVTVIDLLTKPEIVDIIGRIFRLEPIQAQFSSTANSDKPVPFKRLIRLRMIKDSDWKVDSYVSELKDR